MRRVFFNFMALGLFLSIAGLEKAGYTFTTLDVPGSNFTQASGINDSGQIVETYQVPRNSIDHGYLLSGGSYTKLDILHPGLASAYDINNSGQMFMPRENPPAFWERESGSGLTHERWTPYQAISSPRTVAGPRS
jgi:hypothetical protein